MSWHRWILAGLYLACLFGLFLPSGDFVETPELAIQTKQDSWRTKRYRSRIWMAVGAPWLSVYAGVGVMLFLDQWAYPHRSILDPLLHPGDWAMWASLPSFTPWGLARMSRRAGCARLSSAGAPSSSRPWSSRHPLPAWLTEPGYPR